MTTTYAAIQLTVSGKPYVFSSDVTDGATPGSASPDTTIMTNIVSGLGIGDTFSAGGVIQSIGPVTLASSDGTGASKSVLGAVLTDPQNNVVGQFNWVDTETMPVRQPYMCQVPVGLNYALHIITSNT
jgi:hypothetical protein